MKTLFLACSLLLASIGLGYAAQPGEQVIIQFVCADVEYPKLIADADARGDAVEANLMAVEALKTGSCIQVPPGVFELGKEVYTANDKTSVYEITVEGHKFYVIGPATRQL